jgi:hypothetical protein
LQSPNRLLRCLNRTLSSVYVCHYILIIMYCNVNVMRNLAYTTDLVCESYIKYGVVRIV